MKILVVGINGFIGKGVARALQDSHEIYGTSIDDVSVSNIFKLDLLNPEMTYDLIMQIRPDAIVNSAGVVENSKLSDLNPVFTTNLLEAAKRSRLKFKKLIISGSAAEYGQVKEEDIPVNENASRRASGDYGLSKVKEVDIALGLGEKYGLPVTIARIFNPLGIGMHPRLLLPGLLQQVEDYKSGKIKALKVRRLNTKRDYINVLDVGLAVKSLIENNTKERVYNVGSGKSTSVKELLDLIIEASDISTKPLIEEESDMDEPLVAIQADISRIRDELGWTPTKTVGQTVKEVIDAGKQ